MEKEELANVRMMGTVMLLSGQAADISHDKGTITGEVRHALDIVDEILKQTGVVPCQKDA